jgi:hypothetical protein
MKVRFNIVYRIYNHVVFLSKTERIRKTLFE